MASVVAFLRRRELWLFLVVGAFVALLGQALLTVQLRSGATAGLANLVQIVVTLQLSFMIHDVLTWRAHTGGLRLGRWRRWRRFQLARGASALLSVFAFPFLAPVVGSGAAYWMLLITGTAINFCTDRFWSFARTVTGNVARAEERLDPWQLVGPGRGAAERQPDRREIGHASRGVGEWRGLNQYATVARTADPAPRRVRTLHDLCFVEEVGDVRGRRPTRDFISVPACGGQHHVRAAAAGPHDVPSPYVVTFGGEDVSFHDFWYPEPPTGNGSDG